LVLAALFGVMAGAVGAFISFLGPSLPTGPFMVLGGSAVFGAAFLFAPHHGVIMRWWRRRSRSLRVQRENTLKSIYHVLESRDFKPEGVTAQELAEKRRETLEDILGQLRELRRHEFATLQDDDHTVFLTPEGWQRACAIVRNHRLWELYLTNAAKVAADHVHEDAEKIEHVLGEDVVRQLEKRLNYATHDPHGKAIPGQADIQRGGTTPGRAEDAVGYGKRS
jgi:Mn-dependent DtxR family transcriptional regulator